MVTCNDDLIEQARAVVSSRKLAGDNTAGIDESNLDAEVVLGRVKTARLRELLLSHDWPEPYSSRW